MKVSVSSSKDIVKDSDLGEMLFELQAQIKDIMTQHCKEHKLLPHHHVTALAFCYFAEVQKLAKFDHQIEVLMSMPPMQLMTYMRAMSETCEDTGKQGYHHFKDVCRNFFKITDEQFKKAEAQNKKDKKCSKGKVGRLNLDDVLHCEGEDIGGSAKEEEKEGETDGKPE